MARGRLFGDRPVDAVTIVERPVSRSFACKARVAARRSQCISLAVAPPLPGSDHRDVRPIVPGVRCGSGFPTAVLERSASLNVTVGWRTL